MNRKLKKWSDLDPGLKDSRGFHMKGKRAAGRVGVSKCMKMKDTYICLGSYYVPLQVYIDWILCNEVVVTRGYSKPEQKSAES